MNVTATAVHAEIPQVAAVVVWQRHQRMRGIRAVAEITTSMIKELRERTGAGILESKKALEETGGDLEKAAEYLRERGLAKAAKKAGREARQGTIVSYIHSNNQYGSLVEVNCETDFVARTPQFQALAHEIAMQVVAANPRWVRREDVDEAELEREREILAERARQEGKPENIIPRIVEGGLKKFYTENVLYEQEYIKDPSKTISQLVQEAIAQLGENVVIRRFTRYELGG
jgi:elongation factor Ts